MNSNPNLVISLKLLLSHQKLCKDYCMSDGILTQLMERICKSLQTPIVSGLLTEKLDENQQEQLKTKIHLIRHLMYNFTPAKVIGVLTQKTVYNNVLLAKLNSLISSKGLSDTLLDELIAFFHNLFSNCSENKIRLSKSKESDSQIFGNLFAACRKRPGLLFRYFEVLNVLVLEEEAKLYLFKAGLISSLVPLLFKGQQSSIVLKTLTVFSCSMRCRIMLMQVAGILDACCSILETPNYPSVVYVLMRNLATPNENKAHFLTHGKEV